MQNNVKEILLEQMYLNMRKAVTPEKKAELLAMNDEQIESEINNELKDKETRKNLNYMHISGDDVKKIFKKMVKEFREEAGK